jgi:hypothetical protein
LLTQACSVGSAPLPAHCLRRPPCGELCWMQHVRRNTQRSHNIHTPASQCRGCAPVGRPPNRCGWVSNTPATTHHCCNEELHKHRHAHRALPGATPTTQGPLRALLSNAPTLPGTTWHLGCPSQSASNGMHSLPACLPACLPSESRDHTTNHAPLHTRT